MQPTLPSCQRRQMMTRWALLTLLFMGFAQFQGYAQTLYNYSNDSLGIPLAGPMGLSGSNLTRGAFPPGVRASSAPCGPTQGFGSNGWPTTNTFDVGVFNTAGDFVEFTLTPAMGNGLKITGFSARSRRENLTGTADDGPIAIRYGFRVGALGAWTTVNPGNPQSSNVCASGGVNRVWPAWTDTLVSQPITFRIYGLSSGSSGRGDLFLRDVIVNGTVCASAPSISPSPANFLVCKGQTSYSMGYTLETGDTYSINYNPAANTAGFMDVTGAMLPAAPGSIPWSIPANAPAGNYNAVLTIANACGFKTDYNVVVTVSALPNVHSVLSDTEICTGGSFTLTIQDSSATGHTFHLIADLVDDDGITPLEFFNVPNGASLMLTEGVHFDGDINNIVSIQNISVEDETTHCVSYPSNRSITVLDLPRVSISLSDLAICDDGEVTLKFKDREASGHLFTIEADVIHDGAPFSINYTGVASGDSITYTEGADFEGSLSGEVSLENIVITDQTTGCDTTLADLSITVNPYPVASVAVAPLGSICPGSTIILSFKETAWSSGTEFTLGADAVPQVYGLDSLTFYEVIDGDTIQLKEGFHFTGDLAVSQIWVTEPVSGCSSAISNFSVDVLDPASFGFSASVNPEPGIPGDNQSNTLLSDTIDVDFCAGEQLLLSGYSDNGDIGYISSYVSSGNVTNDGNLLPLFSGITDISAANASTFFSTVYGGALGYGLSSGTTGTVNQIFSPYVDNDNSGSFTPGDCEGAPIYLNYHVYAIPTVTATPSATSVCKGGAVSVVFSGNYASGVTYNWSNSNTTIGLAASGSGNISFNGINNSNINQVATLTVTPVAQGCSGTPINVTITVHPEPVVTNITATVSGGMLESGNNLTGPDTLYLNFCAGQSFGFSGYSATAGMGFLEQITAGTTNLLAGGGPIPVPRAQTDISASGAAAFFSGTAYGPYALASGTYGWFSQVFTPYFDANTDGSYDPMTDCLSDKPITLIYRVFAPIVVNVTRNNAGEICSGDVVDYDITTTASQDVLVDIVLEANPGVGSPADLSDDNTPPLPITKTLTINNLDPDSVAQTILNAVGSFDRGRVRLRVENARYAVGPTCNATINHPQQNTQIYPKPFLTDPADTTILAGTDVTLNFSPLAGLPSTNASTAGFGVRARWTTTTTAGVNVVGPNNGTTLIYDQLGVLTPGDDLVKTINLANNTCSGTVTFTITPEADGPNPGGGFDAVICAGTPFEVVVDVVRPVELSLSAEFSPVGCGDTVKVVVRANNFCDLNSLVFSPNWDEADFEYIGLWDSPLADAEVVFPGGSGDLDFQWLGNPTTLVDGSVVFCYYLKALANTGSDLVSIANPLSSNSDDNAVPVIIDAPLTIEIAPLSLVLTPHPAICATQDTTTLLYCGVVGNPNYYVIDFSPNAEAIGFPPFDAGTLVPNGNGCGTIVIDLSQVDHPIPNGSYSATITISNTNTDCESIAFPFVIVVESNAPEASVTPELVEVECASEVPVPNIQVVTATDDCPGDLTIVALPDTDNEGSGCCGDPLIITRTYKVTDAAGNTTLVTQTISVEDCEAPVIDEDFELLPCYASVQAVEDYIEANLSNYLSDNCSNPSILGIDIRNTNEFGCEYVVTIAVKDECGNSAAEENIYTTIIDDEAPVLEAGQLAFCYESAQDAMDAAKEATSYDEPCSDVTLSATITGPDNHCNYVITVTATDFCNHAASVTYPPVRIDGTAPVILQPNVLSVGPNTFTSNALEGECYQTEEAAGDSAIAKIKAADDCSQPGEIILTYEVLYASENECAATKVVVEVTDECGNVTYVIFPGIHIDDVAPVIPVPQSPEDTVLIPDIACFQTIEAAEAYMEEFVRGIVEDCTPTADLEIVGDYELVEDAFCESGLVTVTVTDCAGNTSSESYPVDIDPNDPLFDALPTIEVVCLDDIPAAEDFFEAIQEDFVQDDCSDVTIEVLEDVLPTGCGEALQGHRTYRVTDCAGNSSTQTQILLLDDNVAPEWEDNITTSTLACNCDDEECIANLTGENGYPVVVDNGCSNIEPTLVSETEDQDGCTRTITRVWTAEDDCGNQVATNFIQVIHITDNEAPTFDEDCQFMPPAVLFTSEGADCPAVAEISLEVGDVLSPFDTWTVAGFEIPNLENCVSDNCTDIEDIDIIVSNIEYDDELEQLSCARLIRVSFAIGDACGNLNPQLFVCEYLIIDDEEPTWTTGANALNVTVQCGDDVALAIAQNLEPVAVDNCDQEVVIQKFPGGLVEGNCPSLGTYTNTWIATDCSSNSSTVFTQIINMIDNKPPTFDPQCQSTSLSLYTTPLTGPAANCPQQASISLTLNQEIGYMDTWTVAGVGVSPLGECVFDNCDGSEGVIAKVVAIEDVYNSNNCSRTITVRFQLRDQCGNIQPTLFVRVYNVIDNTPPTATGTTIGTCYQTQAAAEAAAIAATTGMDICSSVTKTAQTVGTCAAVITVTVTDCSGNTATKTYNTRIDNAGPTLTEGTILNCYPDIPTAEAAAKAATGRVDNCPGGLSISASTTGLCNAQITVTVTDGCGNSSAVVYGDNGFNICIGPSTGLTITTQAKNDSTLCETETTALQNWLNNHGGAVASDANATWTYSAVTFGPINCTSHSKTATVTFTAMNGCGYTAQTTASFKVKDLTPPTANLIANTNLSCVADTLPANINVVTGVSDNCDTNPTVTLFANTKSGSGCPGNPLIIARTYLVTDDYCNTKTVTQMITVVDNVAPTFTAPANITVNVDANCNYVATTNITGDVTNEADNCTPAGPMLQAFYTDVVNAGTPGQNPKFTITRTWKLTDACGNTGVPKVQTISVRDLINPTIVGCPSSQTVAGGIIEGVCGATFGGQSTPAFQDNCSGAALSYTLTGATTGSGSGPVPGSKVFLEGTTTVTYTVTDAVGNTAACSYTITVNCLTLSGRIIWDHDDASGVKDATVKLSQGAAQLGSDLSDTLGVYDLSVPAAGIFRVTPVKNINRLNCQPGGGCNVNAADATRILDHVNFVNAITDPYKKVCADVNRSGVITNVDANLITQSIAGNPTALALFNVFWRFTPTDYIMPVTAHQNVPAFPEFKDVTVGAVDITGIDFFGMKIGDVDAAWANPQNAPNLAPLVWVLQDQTLVAGTELEVAFAASNFNDFASYQLALDFDPTQLQYVGFQSMGALSMNPLDNFGAYHADMGELRNVWAAGTGTTLEEGTQVFRLKFKVLTGGQKLSQVLKLDNAQIDCKAFNAALVPAEMKLVFTSSVSTDSPMELSNLELQLMQNRPNPFTDATTIGFILPEACEAHIRILDISGRELTSYDRKYTAGYHELDFRMENAASYGILFCELVTPQGKRTIKMITTK